MNANIVALIATILIIISYIPQIATGLKRKSMKDVSLSFLIIIALGIFMWIIYGIMTNDSTLIIANSIIFVFALSLLAMKLIFG